jgi:hypothetical protein
VFYKSLPSEKKQKEAPCPDCDSIGKRIISPFLTGGTQSGGIEKAMGNNADQVNVGGRMAPAYRDANGQLREVKSVRDMDNWQKSNQYGTPRMTKWRNPKTGEVSMVPQRIRMIADPISGEPMDAPVVRESVPLVPLDDFQMPTHTKNDIPLNSKGVVDWERAKNAAPPGTRGVIDPETGKQITLGGMWGNQFSGVKDGNRDQGKQSIAGKTGMTKGDAARILASE